jgi:OOP family OmpA-OmpF porin
MRASLLALLVIAAGCAKPGDLAGVTCAPVSSWASPASSCGTGMPATTTTTTTTTTDSAEPAPEPEGEIEMGGDKAPDKEADKEPEPEEEPVVEGKASIEGDNIVLGGKILFKKDSDDISDKSAPILDDVVTLLKEHKEIKKVEVAGYTDNKGKKDKNVKQSAARAKAVRDYLVDHGIKGKRVTSKGYGSADPIASNKTKAGRGKNRRIEIHITERK